MTDYYDRVVATHTDGTPSFATDADRGNEADAIARLEAAWQCSVKRFGHMAPIDFFCEQHGRLVAVAELKSRMHAAGTYPDVFLNLRKWLALQLASIGLNVPALFIVRFTDRMLYVPISDLHAPDVTIGGTRRIVKSRSDIEPVVLVPISEMREVQA